MNQQLNVSRDEWNQEFSSGRWDYLDSDLNERARHAVIGMYCQALLPSGAILDVGCGEGTLTDFLSEKQKKNYLGIDISDEAIKKAKQKRGLNFVVTAVEDFLSDKKFDVIVCNEMLYYVDFRKTINHLEKMMSDKGYVIVSLYQTEENKLDEPIFVFLDSVLSRYKTTKLSGAVQGQEVMWTIALYTKK